MFVFLNFQICPDNVHQKSEHWLEHFEIAHELASLLEHSLNSSEKVDTRGD